MGAGMYCQPHQAIRKVEFAWVSNYPNPQSSLFVSGGIAGTTPGHFDNSQNFIVRNASRTFKVRPNAHGAPMHQPALVTGHYYGIAFNSIQDVENFQLRYSEPDYLNVSATGKTYANDWVGLTLGWVQKRYSLQFNYPSVIPFKADSYNWGDSPVDGKQVAMPLVKRNTLPPLTSYFGTASYPGGPGNNTVNLLLTPNISAHNPGHYSNLNAITRGAGQSLISNSYTLDMTYNLCPPVGCNYVPSGALGAPQLWSESSLASVTAGQDVTLDPSMYIILDVSPPPLGTITIQGRLEFNSANPVGRNLTLTARNIFVWGSLAVGSKSAPYASQAYIVLTGALLDPDVILDNTQIVGHKAIVNVGNVTLFGSPHFSKSWVRLATTANALANTLVLAESPGWAVGNRIVVSPTEYPSWNNSLTQVETNYITGVSADGRTLTLRSPLKYRHFAGPLSLHATAPAKLKNTRLAAAVGLLSRNVVVMGDVVRYSTVPSFGGHIYSGIVKTGAGAFAKVWQGQVTASAVEFRDMGKDGMKFAAVNLEYPRGGATALRSHSFVNCSFTNGHNTGLMSHGTVNTVFSDNVMYSTMKHGVFLDPKSTGALITRNLIVGNYLSPNTYADGRGTYPAEKVYTQGAIVLGIRPLLLADNYVGGAYDMAYIMPAMDCGATGADLFMQRNEAAAVNVGFFLLGSSDHVPFTRSKLGGCNWVDHVTVWKASYMGIYAADFQGNFLVTNAVLADNHIGFAGYFHSELGGSFTTPTWSEIANSTIVGTSPASVCGASVGCNTKTSKTPRNNYLGQQCASAVGAQVRRTGVLLPQYSGDSNYLSDWSPGNDLPVYNMGIFGCTFPLDNQYGPPLQVTTSYPILTPYIATLKNSLCRRVAMLLRLSRLFAWSTRSSRASTRPTAATTATPWPTTPAKWISPFP